MAVQGNRCSKPSCYVHDGELCADGEMDRERCPHWIKANPQAVKGRTSQQLQDCRDAASHDRIRAKHEAEVAFLDRVYDLCRDKKGRKALSLVFDTLDDWLLARNVEACDRVLKEVDEQRLDATTIIGFLSISLQGRAMLSERAGYFKRAWAVLALRRSPEEASELLEGLE